MKKYFRETVRGEGGHIPTDIFYEVSGCKVLRVVEVDGDASFYWNDLQCYKPGDETDDYRIKRGSLKEHDLLYNDNFAKLEREFGVFWQIVTKHEFQNWFQLAKKIGKRRWERGVGDFVVSDEDN